MADDDYGNIPDNNIKTLAEWAIADDHKEFRKQAAIDFVDAMARFQDAPRLSPEEEQFCAGWIYLVRMETGVDPETLDAELVKRARETLSDPAAYVRSA